jgi:hemerythrin-like metal-binding protein
MPKLLSLPSRPLSHRRPVRVPASRRRDVLAEINTANECLLFLVSAMFGANRPCQRIGGSCPKIGDLLTFLRRRFAEEERMMDDFGYRPAGLHRAEHRAILARLETMHSTLECGKYDADAVLAFLESWVIDHIEIHDKPLGQCLAISDMEGDIPAPRAPRRESHVAAAAHH